MCSSQWSSCRDQTGCSRCESADRWVAAEGGVAAGSVVVGQPAVQGGGALVVAGPGGGVGPFGLQGAVLRAAGLAGSADGHTARFISPPNILEGHMPENKETQYPLRSLL